MPYYGFSHSLSYFHYQIWSLIAIPVVIANREHLGLSVTHGRSIADWDGATHFKLPTLLHRGIDSNPVHSNNDP